MRQSLRSFVIQFLLVAALTLSIAVRVCADVEPPSLPADFVPITNEVWLEDGAQIVIGVEAEADNTLYVATGNVKNNFLIADAIPAPSYETLTISDATQVWTIVREGRFIKLAQDGKYLAQGKSATNIKFVSSSDDAISYRVVPQTEGTFKLEMANESGRNLVLDYVVSGDDYRDIHFGNYKYNTSYAHLRLYRYAHQTLNVGGEATMPDDGVWVTLYSQGFVPIANGVSQTSDYLLSDGTLAPSIEAQRWFTEVRDATTLALYDAEGNFLNAELQPTSEETWWTLRDGALWQGERVLRYLTAQQRFAALSSDEIAEEQSESVSFLPFAEEPRSTYSDGVLTLRGGFSAQELANIDWQGAYLLDLANTPIPRRAKPFVLRPKDSNNLILVSEEAASFVPHDWDFAVSKGSVFKLLTNAVLTDRVPLHLPADILISEGQVSYTRTLFGDGSWETLVLPFNAETPTGIEAEKLSETDETCAYFTSTNAIVAGEGLIFRPTDATLTQTTFSSRAGMMSTTPSGNMVGTFHGLSIQADNVGTYYFLNNGATSFVRVASGSKLAPFRAALKADGIRRISHK